MVVAPTHGKDEERLATLYQYSILDTGPEQSFDDVTTLAAYVCEAPFATVMLVDRDRQWFKSALGFGTRETGRTDGFSAYALLNPEPMVIRDTRDDPQFAEVPLVLGAPEIRFYAGAPLVAPNGHILGTVCVFDTKPREISSAQVKALQALSRQVVLLFEARLKLLNVERAAAALMQTEKLAAVGRMASSMAHGINNPLEAVTNLLYLALHKVQDAEVAVWLAQADQELRQLSLIANQSLQFHKQLSVQQAITCLELIEDTLVAFRGRLTNAKIQVEKRMRAIEPVECSAGDIRHALGNIVTNAIDAMSQGGRMMLRSRLGTNWTTGKSGIFLTVADTGSGMDAATDLRAFEAFFSTKGIGGSGLGLWIAAEIMQRHGGRIALRSRQGKGTVAVLFLPLQVVAVA
jgi:two-component system, NtrC family, sensor kinase